MMRPLTPGDLPHLRNFWIDHWGGELMVVHGRSYLPERVDGIVMEEAGQWLGLVTFVVDGEEAEIISLDSLRKSEGLGSSLLENAVHEVQGRGCRRILVSTTNDSLRALGFYQKRGFEISAIRRGAVNEARRAKPGISLIGEHGIPIQDEIELERML